MFGKSKRNIFLKDIYTGTVVLVKEHVEGEKVPITNDVIASTEKGTISCLEVRKIVFSMKGNEGVDISNGLKKKNRYTYKVIDASEDGKNLNVKNNTLVISNPKKVGDVLFIAGYPRLVRHSNAKTISKVLLSGDKLLKIREHSIKLSSSDFIEPEVVARANEQASNLYVFKSYKLPTKQQEIEKVYVKHFK